jgi:hypothetical protein
LQFYIRYRSLFIEGGIGKKRGWVTRIYRKRAGVSSFIINPMPTVGKNFESFQFSFDRIHFINEGEGVR